MAAGKKSLMKLKKFIVKLKWCMKMLQPVQTIPGNEDMLMFLARPKQPALVPKGHFAILAGKSSDDDEQEDLKRFVVDIKYLRSPQVLKLLQEAEEEYGLHQQGALVVPCTSQELHKILDNL
ncbi:unnamed protein product [Amaranthus hypochondriacus]